MIRCTNCEKHFTDEEKLEIFPDGANFFRGCPDCKTDEYLTDIEETYTISIDVIYSAFNEREAKEKVNELLYELSKMEDEFHFVVNHADKT